MKVLLSFFFLIIVISCSSKNETNSKNQIEDSNALLKAKIKAKKDSIAIIDEVKAIGNIHFGISEKEFDRKIKLFDKESQCIRVQNFCMGGREKTNIS
jgi:hypothetical protein